MSELPLIKVSLNVIASLFSSFCLVVLCFFPLSKTIQVSFSNSTKIFVRVVRHKTEVKYISSKLNRYISFQSLMNKLISCLEPFTRAFLTQK